jgi:predicted DNA-binding ribbon-helix-helix protein
MTKKKTEIVELLLDIDVYKLLTEIAKKKKMSFDELVSNILREEIAKKKAGKRNAETK